MFKAPDNEQDIFVTPEVCLSLFDWKCWQKVRNKCNQDDCNFLFWVNKTPKYFSVFSQMNGEINNLHKYAFIQFDCPSLRKVYNVLQNMMLFLFNIKCIKTKLIIYKLLSTANSNDILLIVASQLPRDEASSWQPAYPHRHSRRQRRGRIPLRPRPGERGVYIKGRY